MKRIIMAIITIIALIASSFQVYAANDAEVKVYSPYKYMGKGALDAKQSFDTKQAMKSFSEKYLDDGMRAFCKEDNTWYEYNSNNTSNSLTGKWAKIKTTQYDEMPEPTADILGDVYQYIGEDNAEFKSGYFYKVEKQGNNYVYKQTNVQDQVKIDPIVLDNAFKNTTYNKNKLNITNASIKIYNGMIYANVVANYKVKKTDISTQKEVVMVLPEIPATASTVYPYSCQVTITTPKDEYITCMENKNEFFTSGGAHYVNPNVAVGEPFFINNFTRIENAYSDASHTQPIDICEASTTSSGVVFTSDGINPDVKKHGVHFNIGQAIPETLYRCVGQPIKYTEVNGYYDNTGTHH
ncbi:MAG: hypothetical protein MJ151_01780, partial [Lachnospiraceae bacterium]|nr:hypothetical protein [Lachnospiraceae bacterium]